MHEGCFQRVCMEFITDQYRISQDFFAHSFRAEWHISYGNKVNREERFYCDGQKEIVSYKPVIIKKEVESIG